MRLGFTPLDEAARRMATPLRGLRARSTTGPERQADPDQSMTPSSPRWRPTSPLDLPDREERARDVRLRRGARLVAEVEPLARTSEHHLQADDVAR